MCTTLHKLDIELISRLVRSVEPTIRSDTWSRRRVLVDLRNTACFALNDLARNWNSNALARARQSAHVSVDKTAAVGTGGLFQAHGARML